MNTKRINRPAIMSETAGQWRQAIRGSSQARNDLLQRIMPAHGIRAR